MIPASVSNGRASRTLMGRDWGSSPAPPGANRGKFHCSGTLPDQDGSGVAFYRSQANIRFSASTLIKCERLSCN